MPGRKPPRLPEGDDGRTIANMDVDGMPWYLEKQERPLPGQSGAPLSREQRRTYTWAAVRAGLVVVLIFGAVYALFIAFCDFIWFR